MLTFYMFKRKIKQLLCKHNWSPITLQIDIPANYSGKRIIAYASCQKCRIGRMREHFVPRKSMLEKSSSADILIQRFSWAIAGALAREIHGKKLTNYHLGWID